MTVWNLAPGEEQPTGPPRRKTGTAALRGLTPHQVADRAEALGARVEFKDCKYRVYPANPAQGPVFFSDKFGDYHSRSNAISALRRAGIDITIPPEQGNHSMPAAPAKPPGNAVPTSIATKQNAVSLSKLEQQFRDLLELVTENDTDRDRELTELRDRVTALEDRLAATPGAPPAKDPNAELDEAILTFLRSMPIKHTAAGVHANLTFDGPATAALVGERLHALSESGKVTSVGSFAEGQGIYHIPSKLQGGKA